MILKVTDSSKRRWGANETFEEFRDRARQMDESELLGKFIINSNLSNHETAKRVEPLNELLNELNPLAERVYNR